MPWYAVYETATGALRSSGSVVATDDELALKGLTAKEYAVRPLGFDWNSSTLDYDIPVEPEPTVISARSFKDRFTLQERLAIQMVRRSSDAAKEELAATLDVLFDMIESAGYVTSGAAEIDLGLNALTQAGILTPERAAEIGGF